MKKLTELAINRPLLITVIFTVLILFGLIGYNNLNYNLLPKFNANVVTVITTYVGASAEEVESTVTKNVEEAVSSMEGVDKITSTSLENLSMVTVQLLDGVDVDIALNDAQRKINQIRSRLPDDIDDPILNKFSSDDVPVLRIGATGDIDDKTLYDILDLQVKPQISSIKGVGQINLIGGNERQITVNLNKNKLEAFGLSPSQVIGIVNASSLSVPAGSIKSNESEYAIKFDSKISNVDDLRQMPIIRYSSGGQILLSDVAEVVDGQKEATTINHVNGIPSIGIQILKQSDANAVEVSELVKAKLKDIETQFESTGMKFTIASDQAIYTKSSANAVVFDIGLAIVIVSLIMLFFLHSFRSSMFVLVSLPASMIPTFLAMYLFGFSLNLMTLMALSLVVGVLVDDSIVILENIMRHMEMGKNKRQATVDGRSEIGFTALAITLVDVVVFLPMSLVQGMIGNILREFSLVIVVSVLMSLFVCFTITPLLTSRFGKVTHLNPKSIWGRINIKFEEFISGMRDGYTKILSWVLDHKRYMFGFIILLFIGTGMLLSNGFIGTSFMTQADQGEFIISLEADQNTSLDKTNEMAQQAERILLAHPEVINVFSNIGVSSNGMGQASQSNFAEISVKIIPKNERPMSVETFSETVRTEINTIAGVKATIKKADITGNSGQAPIQFIVKGNDRKLNRAIANKIMEITKSKAGTVDVDFSTDDPKPQIDIQLDREKMLQFGLNAQTVGAAIGGNFSGSDQAKYTYEGNEYDIKVKSDDFNKNNINDVKQLTFANNEGQTFELQQFASVREVLGETKLERKDRLPSIAVNSYVVGRSVGTVGAEIDKDIKKLGLYEDSRFQIQKGGMLEMQGDAFSSLLMALGIGFLLVYLIMVALYENAVYPFVVLFALPTATTGAFLALALSMKELTIFAMIGLIMLMGLVAKNGILIVDFANQRKAEGAGLKEALLDAGRERFRPILMTTIAMIFGMMPIALASGDGAEVKNGMAWVIIGGLSSSLLLTLVLVPSVYMIIEKLLVRSRKKKYKKLRKEVVHRQHEAVIH